MGSAPPWGPVSERADRPLHGVGVVVTRDESGDGPLTAALRERGADVIHWPVIAVAPPEDPRPLDSAASQLASYDWVALTSRRAVAALAERVREIPSGVRLAAVGEGTGEAAEARGWRVDLVAGEQTGEALVAAFQCEGLARGARVLFPASDLARDTVPAGLERAGAAVERVTAYRIVPAALDADACRRMVEEEKVDVVSVTSPSSGENLIAAVGEALFRHLAETVPFAAIGPTTATALRSFGVKDVVEAEEHSFDGLAEAVARHFAAGRGRGAT